MHLTGAQLIDCIYDRINEAYLACRPLAEIVVRADAPKGVVSQHGEKLRLHPDDYELVRGAVLGLNDDELDTIWGLPIIRTEAAEPGKVGILNTPPPSSTSLNVYMLVDAASDVWAQTNLPDYEIVSELRKAMKRVLNADRGLDDPTDQSVEEALASRRAFEELLQRLNCRLD